MPDDLSAAVVGGRASLADAPSLIESAFPVSRLSLESFIERDAKQNQTLTATGSYWKGRKPLILVRACVLASLLPSKGRDAPGRARDMEMFLRLMAMDDEGLRRRHQQTMKAAEAAPLLTEAEKAIHFEPGENMPTWRRDITPQFASEHLPSAVTAGLLETRDGGLVWRAAPPDVDGEPDIAAASSPDEDEEAEAVDRRRWSPVTLTRKALRQQGDGLAFERMTYLRKLDFCVRPEELTEAVARSSWDEINEHYGTSAQSLTDFVDQIGRMRFGRRPRVSDRFAGGGAFLLRLHASGVMSKRRI